MASPSKQTIVYRTVNGLDISFDLYLPPNAKWVPILLWFHGGGLLQGHREKVAPHMLESVNKYNHALISADYRLAPQVGMNAIFEDIDICIAFIRSPNGLIASLGNAANSSVDHTRLAVSGSSAGGYLAFIAGLYVNPKPQVILPIYPITDPLGTFFTTSQPGSAQKGDIDATVQPYLDRNAAAVANNDPGSSRGNMYSYMLSHANLAELLHIDTGANDPANDAWRVARKIAEHRLPPTYIVHGTADLDVGVEQADEVVGVMVGEGLKVKYERLAGKDHLFDVKDPSEKLEGMYEFMHKHIGAPPLVCHV
jgi:acetyl esterase/lipase